MKDMVRTEAFQVKQLTVVQYKNTALLSGEERLKLAYSQYGQIMQPCLIKQMENEINE